MNVAINIILVRAAACASLCCAEVEIAKMRRMRWESRCLGRRRQRAHSAPAKRRTHCSPATNTSGRRVHPWETRVLFSREPLLALAGLPTALLTTWPSAGRYRWLADRRSCDQCLSARACGSWETLRLHHHARTARAGGGHFALLLQGPKCSRDQLARRLPWPERDQRRHGRLAAAPVPMFARNRHAMHLPCIHFAEAPDGSRWALVVALV